MITIKIFVFNPLQVNTYVLSDETGECVVIDPACYTVQEKEILDRYLADNHLTPVKVVNTHGHVDHIVGMRHMAQKYNPKIEIHEKDIPLLQGAKSMGRIFGFEVEEPPVITGYLSEGTDVTFGNSLLQVYHVPGHSQGSVAFFEPQQKFVITGDVLFKGSIGRTDLFEGDYDQLMDSIYKKIMLLPPDTQVFPGHGPFTTIHEEALSNPFLG
jgi:hydroxyacylglutathione hydrolase